MTRLGIEPSVPALEAGMLSIISPWLEYARTKVIIWHLTMLMKEPRQIKSDQYVSAK